MPSRWDQYTEPLQTTGKCVSLLTLLTVHSSGYIVTPQPRLDTSGTPLYRFVVLLSIEPPPKPTLLTVLRDHHDPFPYRTLLLCVIS